MAGSGKSEVSTTGAVVGVLGALMRDKEIGPRIVPILCDEGRTFGMESFFKPFGIYSSLGQLYTPVDADFLLVAEMEGQPVGFSLTVPDFNQATQAMKGKMLPFGWLKFLLGKRKIDYARTILMGVLPEYRKLGIDVAMVYRTMQAGFAKGITRGECSWILADNVPMNRILEGYGADMYKTYRIYEKQVG